MNKQWKATGSEPMIHHHLWLRRFHKRVFANIDGPLMSIILVIMAFGLAVSS